MATLIDTLISFGLIACAMLIGVLASAVYEKFNDRS